jgi:hypothetical protein
MSASARQEQRLVGEFIATRGVTRIERGQWPDLWRPEPGRWPLWPTKRKISAVEGPPAREDGLAAKICLPGACRRLVRPLGRFRLPERPQRRILIEPREAGRSSQPGTSRLRCP